VSDRVYRDLDEKRRVAEDVDAEELAERFKQKYKAGLRSQGYRGDSEHVAEHMLLPSVNDPSLWLIRCKVRNYCFYSVLENWGFCGCLLDFWGV
jgi:transcription elongation factor SPT5